MGKLRANGEGTLSQRKCDGKWIGQITIGALDGKQIRKSVSAKTQGECKLKLDELKKLYSGYNYIVPSSKTPLVDYLLEVWLVQKGKLENLKKSTINTHKQRINLYIKPYFKTMELQKVNVKIINGFYTSLLSKISSHTIRKVHNIINNGLKHAITDGLIPYNCCADAALPKFKIKKGESLRKEDIPKLLEAAKIYQNGPNSKSFNPYPLIALALNTGMRRGELAGLQWKYVNLDTGEIKIKHTIVSINGNCHLDTPKTDSSIRTIYVSNKILDILKEHRKKATGIYVFPSMKDMDKPISPDNINRTFYNIIKIAGIECSLHSLRHTHITRLLEQGVNIKTIQERAGHTQISTTMGYCHPDKEKDKEAANLDDDLY